MSYQHRLVIYGPPGTGKTSTLIKIIEQELERGTDPRKIAFVSFTRKAVGEAVDRIRERFSLSKSDTINFKTLHALAYHALGISKDDVVNKKHLVQLGDIIGRPITATIEIEEGLPVGNKEGDQMLFLENLSRATGKSLRDVYDDSEPEITFKELEHFKRVYGDYKAFHQLIDFTDFLSLYVEECDAPDVDVVIVDEAQDLFPLQWRMVKHLTTNAKRIFIAGDDDQAIYGWAGADVRYLLNQSGHSSVLKKSYRLPRAVFDTANVIATRIGERKEKVWSPKDDEGSVTYLPSHDSVSFDDGSWFLLGRNAFLLPRLQQAVEDQGYTYTIRHKSSVDEGHAKAILIWEALRKGKPQLLDDVRSVYAYLSAGRGIKRGFKGLSSFEDGMYTMEQLKENGGLLVDDPWFDAFDKIPLRQRDYYRAVMRRGGSLFTEPRIHINTVHGVKGGEADNVLVLADMAWRSYRGLEGKNSDEEHRVFYVAATRAKKSLFLVAPQTRTAYNW